MPTRQFLRFLFGYPRRQAEARPEAGGDRRGGRRCRHDVTPFDQPLEGFLDLVCRKIPFQLARQLGKALATLADRGRQSAIKLAVKKEFPVLGIEADDVGRQHIDGEIRRELRDVLAGLTRRAGLTIFGHDFNTHTCPSLRFAGARGSRLVELPRLAGTGISRRDGRTTSAFLRRPTRKRVAWQRGRGNMDWPGRHCRTRPSQHALINVSRRRSETSRDDRRPMRSSSLRSRRRIGNLCNLCSLCNRRSDRNRARLPARHSWRPQRSPCRKRRTWQG